MRENSGIKRSLKGECFAHCNICNCDINLNAMGKTAISTHIDNQKHKKCVIMINSSQSMNNFFTSRSAPTITDYKAVAAEGTWAFLSIPVHSTVKHQQSFLINDCTSRLFKAIFPDSNIAKKFASARTKTTSIVTPATSPPKKTHGSLDCPLAASTSGKPQVFSLIGLKASITMVNSYSEVSHLCHYLPYHINSLVKYEIQILYKAIFHNF